MDSIVDKLLEKSKEAFITSIELYNKPTIKYRVEGFSFFVCNAWELMLKAYMIQLHGEDSIYYDKDSQRTFSLSKCIEIVFTNKKDPLRLNLEHIVELRNTSTHFITTEYEQIYVPLFQSCVLNYANKMLEFFHQDVIEDIPANFLTLSVKLNPIEPKEVQARYPKQIASHLFQTMKNINESIPNEGNDKYAVLIKHDIYITKKKELATASVSITKDADEAAYIVKEVKDMQKVCPYKRKKCLEILNRWIGRENINFVNPSKDPSDSKYHVFNTSHFDLFVKFYNIKENPKYCYKYILGTQTLYSYSESAVRMIFEELKKDPEHIIQNLREKVSKK